VVSKIEAVIKRVIETLVFLLFAAMVVLVFAQVYTRFFTTKSLTWSEELSRFLMIWMVYLASVLAYDSGIHIVVDSVVNLLKGRAKIAAALVTNALMLLFVGLVLKGAISFLPKTALQRSPANGIVMAYVYVAIPVSMALIGLVTIRKITEAVGALLKKEATK